MTDHGRELAVLTSTGSPWDEVCQLCCLLSDIIIRVEVNLHMVIEDLPRVLSTYEQVEQALSRLVEHLKPGDQFPSEPELARQLGVSRATLREVLRTFTERGILIRRQGIGTFVASRLPLLEAGLEVLESLNRMAQHRGLTTQVSHLTVVERQPTEDEALHLGLVGTPVPVLVVDRVISIEDRPVADLRDVVPVTYLSAKDLGVDFQGSVLDILLQRGDPLLGISRTELTAIGATAAHARRLNLKPGTPLLKFVAQLYTYDEQIVDYSMSVFVPGYLRFHVIRQVRT